MIRRTTIGIFGPANSGKSTLINCLTNQKVSLVSSTPGTTTDPVSKTMEINGIGPCVFIDTPGYDDKSALGEMRVSRTKETLRKCDIAIFVIPSNLPADKQTECRNWLELVKSKVPNTISVINDFATPCTDGACSVSPQNPQANSCRDARPCVSPDSSITINALTGKGKTQLLNVIGLSYKKIQDQMTIVTHLVNPTDTVLLVMPQDTQAPAGRLILPQVQTIRELLDYGCSLLCTTTDNFTSTLNRLKEPPALIVTDSQAFKYVFANRPKDVPLTSFSVLFARWKGDIDTFVEGAKALSSLKKDSRVLIAEACTHAPLAEDIGREKIPALIHKKISPDIRFDIVSGNDWSTHLSDYDLIIHCGACMIGRAEMLSRIAEAKSAGTPITNYGITIAYLNGILENVVW